MLAFVTASYKRISNLFRPAILGTCRCFVNEAELLREDEFDGRIEADIAVDGLAVLVNDESSRTRFGGRRPRTKLVGSIKGLSREVDVDAAPCEMRLLFPVLLDPKKPGR
jgi:hypothetical protein